MIGYEFLASKIPLRMPPLERPARVKPVSRVEDLGDVLAVPKATAPADGATLLDHALFALKHEGVHLPILHEAAKLIDAKELAALLNAQRRSLYPRKFAFIWEKANELFLPLDTDSMEGNYVDMFDDETHYTGPMWEKNPRLRVNWNGIGPYEFCPVLKRDLALEREGVEILEGLQAWASDPDNQGILDRVMDWAYLSETKSTYAIEQETPTHSKEISFRRALESLRRQPDLTEGYLVELQNMVISNPRNQEQQFRLEQNWLQRGGHGAAAVTYVPPEPELMMSLMDGLMRMANAAPTAQIQGSVPPIMFAAVVSFGFVFVHPFMDGNGRVSRLLMHHSLSRQGVMPMAGLGPAILPLSVAMKAKEGHYLDTLESFSKPARRLWDITSISDAKFAFDFQSSSMIYAHWSGQRAAEFMTECARMALDDCLVKEAAFIRAYDRAYKRIDENFELPGKTINLLIHWIRQNDGRMPERRKTEPELAPLGSLDADKTRFEDAIKQIEQVVVDNFGDSLAEMSMSRAVRRAGPT